MLWDARYIGANGNPGWGLVETFDAFQDGSTNPTDTIYSYTTASAVLAFLDGYAVLADATQLTRAKAGMDCLLDECWGYSSGGSMSVWYSDQAVDQAGSTYVVHNTNALTLAALARIDEYDGAAYDAAKRTGIEAMLVAQEGYLGVGGQWRYRLGAGPANNLPHHAWMTLGALVGGLADAALAVSLMCTRWLASDGSFDVNSFDTMGEIHSGPTDSLPVLCRAPGRAVLCRLLAHNLAQSVDVTGISSYATADERSIIRFGLACATYAAFVDGDGALF